jgi:chromosome segregation protein
MVTLSGELLRPDGTRIVPGAGEAAGPITRRAEIRTLGGEASSLDARVRDLQEQLAAARESMQELGARIDEARDALYRASIQEHEVERDLAQTERRLRLAADERRAVEAELADLAREREALIGRHARLAQLAHETAAAHRQAVAELEQLRERGRSFARERERIEQGLAECRRDQVRAAEQIRGCDQQLADAEGQRAEIEAAAARLAEAEADLARRRADAARERDEAEAGRQALETEFGGLDARVRDAEAALGEARAAVARAEQEEHERHEALAQNEGRLRDLEVSLREEEVRVEHLLERLQTEFQMTREDLAARPAPEGPVDRAALAAEVEELKGKVARFGSFNQLALDRLKEVEERVGFLQQQRTDLADGRDKLTALIRELNEEATRRFDATLQQVRENFGDLFRKLFGGGKADVVLVQQEGVDPMDWGVEIMARPPKKELTTLSLLSGGEQALTALALVMALFRSNPSPFCVLDEADAALDEANVGRYTAMVQEFVQQTQVILITHRRPTMAAADILYGVSMPRAGVSTIVNVDFKALAGGAHEEPAPPPAPAPAPSPTQN